MSHLSDQISVLHVDDEPGFAEMAAELLEREDENLAVETVTDPQSAFDDIIEGGYDCVVSDHDMPQMTGVELLRQVRDEEPDLPFILYTGKGSEEVASEAIASGVSDYLQKGTDSSQYALLANRIKNAVNQYRSQEQARNLLRIRKVLRDVNQLLVRARTREEVEGEVCRIISEAEPYRLAWIGEPDVENETVVPRASAGEATDYLDQITVSTDESSTAQGPTGRAVRERELVTAQSISDDPDYDPWREDAQEYGLRSSAAVPMVYEDRLFGVLNVYSERKQAFDELERELLIELAEDIAHGLHRIENEQARKRFEEAVEQTGHAVYITDPDGTIEYVNPAFEQITGYPAEEAIDQNPRILKSGEMAAEYYEELWEAVLAGEVWEEEITNQRRSGEQYVANQTITPITHDDTITGFVAVQADITDHKKRERELRNAERRFEAIFNNPVSFMALLDPDGSVRNANEKALTFVERDQRSVRGQPFWETPWWTHSESLQTELRSWIAEARQGEWVRFEADHYAPDGERVTIDGVIHPVYDDDGNVTELVAAGRDISETKEGERELERAKERYQRLFESNRDAILVANTDREIINCNPAFTDLFGYTLDEIEGKSTRSLYADPTEFEEIDERVRQHMDDPNFYLTVDYQTQSGEVFPGETNVFYLRDEDGTIEAFVETIRDISDRMERAERLERERDRLDAFAGIVSHDLRNPLNVAQGRLELAAEDGDSEDLTAVWNALDRMETLIDDMLALARAGESVGETEPIKLAELIENCWGSVETEAAELAADTDQLIEADQSRLRQLLENLFRNAIEHGGDEVTITVGDLADGFYVEDDGPGIPEDDRERVFEAGYTTNDRGTGFGLSIVNEIVTAHGWAIRITSGANGGARFEITGVETANT